MDVHADADSGLTGAGALEWREWDVDVKRGYRLTRFAE
jgi:hypothetical protein